MAESLIICLPSGAGEPASWAVLGDNGSLAALPERGELSLAATKATGRQIVLIVPGEVVLLTKISLPTQKRQKILQALPYALEDQLADEVENLHFALGPEQEDGSYPVAVVQRQCMEQWLAEATDAGLVPDMIVPDSMLIPLREEDWCAVSDHERVLFRTGPWSTFVADRQHAELMLGLAVTASESPPARLIHYACGEDHLLEISPGMAVVQESCEAGMFTLLARHFRAETCIDLIQGDYSRKERLSQLWRPWRTTAALLIAGLLVVMVQAVFEYKELSQEETRLSQRIEQVYKDAFPNAKRIVNPRAQMQQHLVKLRQGVSGGGGGFLELLALSGSVLKKASDVQVQGISYREGRMDLDVTAKNLQVLDQLKQQLSSDGKLEVDIQSAAADKNQQVKSRLRIRKVGA